MLMCVRRPYIYTLRLRGAGEGPRAITHAWPRVGGTHQIAVHTRPIMRYSFCSAGYSSLSRRRLLNMDRWNLGTVANVMRRIANLLGRKQSTTSFGGLEDVQRRIYDLERKINMYSLGATWDLVQPIFQLQAAVSHTLQAMRDAMSENGMSPSEGIIAFSASSEAGRELENRIKNLSSEISALDVLARGLSRVRISEPTMPSSHTSDQISANNSPSGIVAEMERLILSAMNSFLDDKSKNIKDIVQDIVDMHANATDMRSQYQLAEDAAMFMTQIIDGSNSWRPAGGRQRQQVQQIPAHKDHLSRDIDLWLARGKPVYLLTGAMMGELGAKMSAVASQLFLRIFSESQQHVLAPRLGAAWFFTHKIAEPRQADASLFALAYQLRPDIHSETMSAIRDYSVSGGSESAARDALRKALASTSASNRRCTVIVLDGLDQSGDREKVADLLLYLLTLVSEFSWLRLFLTTHPHPYMMATFALSKHLDLIHHHQLEDSAPRQTKDSQQYLEHEAPKLFARVRAARRYLMAKAKDRRRPPGQLDLLINASTTNLSPLDDFYMRTLQRLLSATSESLQHHAVSLLQFVAVSNSAHIGSILSFANSHRLPHRSEYDIPLSLAGLIEIVDRLQFVLAVNLGAEVVVTDPEFRNFLLDDQRCTDNQFYVNRASTVCAICLNALAEAEHVTATLLVLCPTTPSPRRQYCQNSLAFAILFSFVISLPLTMYAWVSEEHRMLRAGKALAQYFVVLSFYHTVTWSRFLFY
ncbi:hypothetical protein PsYK624_168820 [Phanerochaete sordida]|uniref:Nephrocystin 3-like N-terminal domain-containing protein n=1 Tax=Phanerochaete sordida TaxID=48140 RepID=A0A9P3LM95_9APHY|nr:hypothetical protein PsYK624_168820 [Phanerochaete sordida]